MSNFKENQKKHLLQLKANSIPSIEISELNPCIEQLETNINPEI
jgi:hypothetical protein